ncbi:hypothetical protein A0H76_2694 [Hepatospora eriocheir]|uniref:Uncharacterized protein n=1 Tax=Hepatospora eriocheir TaxID=1081669 RepID=A0A1X0QJQ2_9MICR|nr:hypothetical protein A0H76_2694 [Hepatospora eriocheir]
MIPEKYLLLLAPSTLSSNLTISETSKILIGSFSCKLLAIALIIPGNSEVLTISQSFDLKLPNLTASPFIELLISEFSSIDVNVNVNTSL